MIAVKTIRDDFALLFLNPMVQMDIMRQQQGFPPADFRNMMAQAYEVADRALALRAELAAVAPASAIVQ